MSFLTYFIFVFKFLLIIATFLGNILVMIAIIYNRKLRKPQNYLILSLVLCDIGHGFILLGNLIKNSNLPGNWTLGSLMCQLYYTVIITVILSAQYHLLMIALDRYWSVTNVQYGHKRTAKRIGIMIAVCWTVAFGVTIVGNLTKDDTFYERIRANHCSIMRNKGYVLSLIILPHFASVIFYMICYFLIFKVASSRMKLRKARKNASVLTIEESKEHTEKSSNYELSDNITTEECGDKPRKDPTKTAINREKRLIITLAIVTGCFVVFWLPFHIVLTIRNLCKSCNINTKVGLILWLFGTINCVLNPIIFTIFTKDFRDTFKEILSIALKKCHLLSNPS